MQPHHILWSTIIGYMLFVLALSVVTFLWVRYHLMQYEAGASCALKPLPLTLKKLNK